MAKIIEIINSVLLKILIAFYQPFGAMLLIVFVVMFAFIYAKEHNLIKKDLIKNIFLIWFSYFKESYKFRRVFFIIFFSFMILSRNVLYRDIWVNPLSDIMGGWGIYDINGNLTTEIIENSMLIIPFTIFFLWAFRKELLGDNAGLKKTLWVATRKVGMFALALELFQMLFNLGTFQISDLIYNTLDGTVGGLIYYIIYGFRHRNT